jgi:ribosomal protein S18 acetylase RimI-like enzyme
MITIQPFEKHYITEAASLFVRSYHRLREAVPALPERMLDPTCAESLLDRMLTRSSGAAAFDGSKLIGYLGWWIVDNFRDSPRRAGYVPEWGHATADENKPAVLRALYRAAAQRWHAEGCATHAVSFLADDLVERDTWFWSGFGLMVVDAVRPVTPIEAPRPDGYTLRRATPADAPALAELEAEHVVHYTQPPTLMYPFEGLDPDGYAAFVNNPANFAYLALQGDEPAGYLRFETEGHGSAEIVHGEGSAANTGAYVRSAHRGHGLAPALLAYALADFAALGFQRVSVDFESFNPEAAVFWPRYFTPVCFSVMRVPER